MKFIDETVMKMSKKKKKDRRRRRRRRRFGKWNEMK